MPDQRTTVAVPAALRSVHPGITGVPGWAAVLIGVTGALAGFAIEAGSGHRELGGIFAACYVLGCIAAVLAVRRSGIFTAVIQPPLLLFVAVPLGYFLLHGAPFNGLKDALITCGYPLIERFPLMLFTSAGVLVIGMSRWYFGTHGPQGAAEAAPPAAGLFAGLSARLGGLGRPSGEQAERPARPRHVVDRSGGAGRTSRPGGRTERREAPAAPRARRERPAREEGYRQGYPEQRPRREAPRRPARERDPRDPYYADAPRTRRPRPPRDDAPPPRRAPRERRAPYEPRAGRTGGYQSYDPYDSYEPRPPRPDARRPRATGDNHHPISRVRYRGEPGGDTGYGEPPRRER